MQWHKIVVRTILKLLILSVINFALAAPILERGIRELVMRVDVMDETEDVATASEKRWVPSDKSRWWTNSALADGWNTPQILGSSDYEYRLEQELTPHDKRSPMDSIASPHLGLGSTDRGNSHPLPRGPPPPVKNGLPLDIGSPNTSPQPTQEPTDGSDSHSHSADLPADGSSYYSVDSPTDGSYHSTGSMSPWSSYEAWATLHSPSPSPSHDSNPPPQHGNLDVPGVYHSPSSPATWPGLDLEQPWPYSGPPRPSKSDPGLPIRPYSPSDSVQSTGAHAGPSTGPPTGAHPSGPGSSEPPSPDAAGPSIPHPPSPGPESESISIVSEVLKGGRFKRRTSGSRCDCAQMGASRGP